MCDRLGPTWRSSVRSGPIDAVAADRVAARAAVLDDPLVAGLQLRGLGNVGHLGVALQAARLDEPLGKHREIPEMEISCQSCSSSHFSASSRVLGVCEA